MGQGVYAPQVRLPAEELEVEPASVSFEAARYEADFRQPILAHAAMERLS